MPTSEHWSEESDVRDFTFTCTKGWKEEVKTKVAYAVEEIFWIVVIIILSIILGSILTSGLVLVYALAFVLPFCYSFGKAMRWIK